MIQVENLSKKYGPITAVDSVSFKLDAGQTLALIGTSGCGKTTTLKMINRLIEPSAGRVLLNGKDVREQAPEEMRRQMGYVIQDVGLFPHYTIAQNIGLIPQLLKWDKERIQTRIKDILKQLELDPVSFGAKYPHELSGGQQQRVGIARALAADPPIILMDEPFGALDPLTRATIRKEFLQLDELASKTTILITHDVQEAFEMADLICLLDKGQIQQFGSPKELLYQPSNDFVQRFLADKFLELEWHLICLDDLYDELPDGKADGKPYLTFEGSDTLMQVLTKLRKQSGMQGQIRKKYFSVADLLSLSIKTEKAL